MLKEGCVLNDISIEYCRGILERSCLSKGCVDALVHDFERAERGQGIRAVFLQGLQAAVSMGTPEMQGSFEEVRSSFPSIPPFSFVPLAQLSTLHLYAASLLYPDRDLVWASNELTRQMIVTNAEIPSMQSLIESCDGDPAAYIEKFSDGTLKDFIENFGTRTILERDVKRLFVRHDSAYSEISRFYIPGFYAGVGCWFGPEADVKFERIDEDCFTIEAMW